MVKTATASRRNYRRNSFVQLVAAVILIILINVVSAFVFRRIDLTSEKRFSLSSGTKESLKSLNDVVYIKVYLDGDLPPAYKRLQNAVKEMLDEFRVYAGDNIEYEFIDPSASSNANERNQFYEQLASKGIQPSNVKERGKGETTQKVIFPGALLNHKSRETPLQLLKSSIGMSAEEMSNNSIEGLEYEFMNGLKKLNSTTRKKIAFLQGHSELNTVQLADAAQSINDLYQADTVIVSGRLNALKDYSAIVIAKPATGFDERDKFIIDQFIMNGGRVLWCIDQMQIDMDSLSSDNTTVAIASNVNLDDQLFKYGVRLNFDLVMDLQASPIPIVVGYAGNQPQQTLFPWYYFPLINPVSLHPVVHNLNAIKLEFTGSLDTVEAVGITKTILLTTSDYSKSMNAPVRVSLNMLQEEPDPKIFNDAHLPVAVLLEGSFVSNFTNRVPESISQAPEINFQKIGKPSKMIVVSDGDVLASHISKKGSVFPLGYDRYTGQMYGNKNFFLNCIDYLLDDSGLMTLRSKEFKIRLLDKEKAAMPSVKWTNLLVPVGMIAIYGMLTLLIRKRKFSS